MRPCKSNYPRLRHVFYDPSLTTLVRKSLARALDITSAISDLARVRKELEEVLSRDVTHVIVAVV